jgi:L-ascorbate metabolism protein UlaG (beta-lactamase superfamily)
MNNILPIQHRRKVLAVLSALLALSGNSIASDTAGKTQVLWLGQSAFKITTPGGKVIVIDPWLTKGPRAPEKYKDLSALGKVDLLLVTHAHGDHLGDAPALAKMHNIPLWGPGGMNQALTTLGVLPAAQLPRFDKGGTITPLPGIKVIATHAEHSSALVWRNPVTDRDETHYGGEPNGFIIEMENGFRIYHMGDTGIFSDMKWIGEYYRPDLVLIPIGGNFTMDPLDAAYATNLMLKPRYAIPIHYGSNSLGKGTPKEYIEALGRTSVPVIALAPGETAEF